MYRLFPSGAQEQLMSVVVVVVVVVWFPLVLNAQSIAKDHLRAVLL